MMNETITLFDRVNLALENIRPYLQKDGGDVNLVEITPENIVKIELIGNCGACPMADMTIQSGISDSIKNIAPEIVDVQAINQ